LKTVECWFILGVVYGWEGVNGVPGVGTRWCHKYFDEELTQEIIPLKLSSVHEGHCLSQGTGRPTHIFAFADESLHSLSFQLNCV
jgi:hypothetical protein